MKNPLIYALLWQLSKELYKSFLRGVIANAIKDDKSSIDELAMNGLDKVFGFEG